MHSSDLALPLMLLPAARRHAGHLPPSPVCPFPGHRGKGHSPPLIRQEPSGRCWLSKLI